MSARCQYEPVPVDHSPHRLSRSVPADNERERRGEDDCLSFLRAKRADALDHHAIDLRHDGGRVQALARWWLRLGAVAVVVSMARLRLGSDAPWVAVSRGLSMPDRDWHRRHWRHPASSAKQLDMRIFSTTESYAAPMNREKREIYTQRSTNHRMRAGRSEAHSRSDVPKRRRC